MTSCTSQAALANGAAAFGFTGLAYRSSDARLSFAAGGKDLFVQAATAQCDNGAAGR